MVNSLTLSGAANGGTNNITLLHVPRGMTIKIKALYVNATGTPSVVCTISLMLFYASSTLFQYVSQSSTLTTTTQTAIWFDVSGLNSSLFSNGLWQIASGMDLVAQETNQASSGVVLIMYFDIVCLEGED